MYNRELRTLLFVTLVCSAHSIKSTVENTKLQKVPTFPFHGLVEPVRKTRKGFLLFFRIIAYHKSQLNKKTVLNLGEKMLERINEILWKITFIYFFCYFISSLINIPNAKDWRTIRCNLCAKISPIRLVVVIAVLLFS